ncbi:MAG: hypothetical protein C0403_17270 [Desulfobacterium sp.]|nr:hypothetical protein [Desulfobacterium sp.]
MLSKDFKEFIELLNKNNVRYLVVGGYAVALHGHPRYTKDLDVWIELSPENANKIMDALKQFGFGSLGLKPDDFLVSDQTIQLGYPPNRIDILTTVTGLKFEECYPARVEVEIQGLRIHFIDIENLKKNKRATGRSQDLADAENLEQSGT